MAPTDVVEEAPEDEPQIVKDLKEIDDRYLTLEREYEKEINVLMQKYNEMQKPYLEQRAKVLAEKPADSADSKTGTPALEGFWLQALQNHPAFEEEIESYDEPVLKYLKDITYSFLDTTDRQKGFRLVFHFAENDYFENAVLQKEYHTQEQSPYTGDQEVLEINGCNIKWKPGKNVTVEKVKKQAKGKKAKQGGKEKEEARPSFFRSFFRSLKKGSPLPDDVDPHEISMQFGDADDDDVDEEHIVEMMLEGDLEIGEALRDNIIPFAVRWYTGEAAPEDSDDEDEDDEGNAEDDDEEEEDDEDDDDEDEDEPPAKGPKSKGKKEQKKKPADGDKPKQEECKQQ